MEVALLYPGQERYTPVGDRIRYAYCTERGAYFSCIAKSLDEARDRCEDWMMRRERC